MSAESLPESEMRMENPLDQKNMRLFETANFSPRQTSARISLGYALLGWLWILASDHVVVYLTHDVDTMLAINNVKGSLFVFFTAAVLFFLLHYYLKQIWQTQNKYFASVKNLKNAYEKLSQTNETLCNQYAELTQAADLLVEKDSELWALFENMHDAFALQEILCDMDGNPVDYRFLNVNPAYEKLLGRTRQQLVYRQIREIMPDIEMDWIQLCGEVALMGQTKKVRVYVKQLKRYLDISLHCPKPGRFALLARDITEEKEHAILVERLAYYDSLTGLPNRVRFLKTLHDSIESEDATGALLYIDLDDLKMVNDSYGHSYGDALIITAAMHIVSISNEGSTVARIGGDEFVMLLPGLTDLKQVEKVAHEVVEILSREYEVYELKIHASASVGIVMYPEDGANANDILKNADTALHEAKRGGKRCWRLFKPAMQELAYENMVLSNGLRNAVVNGELALHFQPQVLLSNYHVTAFEALLRWKSVEFGNVSPERFIPLAETSHLIETIGVWVLREACAFAAKLTELGYIDVRVAVNVSPKQLSADDFISIVTAALNEAGIRPEQLEIEITESVLIDSMEDSIRKLKELETLGVHLSLDDFGTGYSSLTYLRQLPVGTVKIDKSFIERITKDSSRSALIAAIINMSHILGLNVVAEGVETPDQLDKLAEYNCDVIQGYVISKALPEQEAIAILRNTWLPNQVACMTAESLFRMAGEME